MDSMAEVMHMLFDIVDAVAQGCSCYCEGTFGDA